MKRILNLFLFIFIFSTVIYGKNNPVDSKYYTKYNKQNNLYKGDFKKDLKNSMKNKLEVKELTKIFKEINQSYMIFAHYPDSNIAFIYDAISERFTGRYIYDYVTIKNGKLYYIINVFPTEKDFINNKNQLAYFMAEIKVENKKEGQDLFVSYESDIVYKGPRTETLFLNIDAVDEALGNR